ncbi:ABC transporter permease [Budvicia aquatica]|uniref:ABC transporter permease n=1 Tax=Budvicia aquatica TaxID=82979 RepID=A0A2C6DMS2_9GAMM|nr:ABC transporter permease [Budvicia aquatica]PHI30084.1 ABC transporter permease [Budvicia aquatica]
MKRMMLTPFWLLITTVVFFTAFFLAPFTVVIIASLTTEGDQIFTLQHYIKVLSDQYNWNVIALTFRIAALTTLISLLLGYPLAWYLVRIIRWKAWRRVCILLVIIPMFTSNIVRSFGWMVLLGRTGLVNQSLLSSGLIESPVRFLGSELGILIGMVYILLPFIVLATGNTLAQIDPSYEQASNDLGANPHTTFFKIILPLTLPGVISGAIMVFTLAASAYVTPALLSGGRISVVSMLIFQQYSTVFNFNYGGALSVVLLFFTLVMVGLAGRIGHVRRGKS